MSSAASADTISYDVHLGFWVNWSHGRMQGATITLTRQSGGLLVAFLALFISAAGTSFWRICCFFCHSILSKDAPQDGLYHQRQAVLRNTESAHQGLWTLVLMGFAWRTTGFPFRRVLPLMAVAMIITIGFALSGIYSSRVTTDNANEVLLTGKNCGIFEQYTGQENASYSDSTQYITQRWTAYLDKSLQCYTTGRASKSEDCRPYIKSMLPYTFTPNASCPFDPAICLQKDNMVIDTGLLNSHEHFGINAPPKSRFHFRSVLSCAPLVTDGFSQIHVNSDPNISVMRYYYGNLPEKMADWTIDSFTYQVPVNFSLASLDNFTSLQSLNTDYAVGALYTSPTLQQQSQTFQPILQLNRTDASLWLFFLSAVGIAFYNPTDDPWFSAHNKTGSTLEDFYTGKPTPLMSSDHPAGVLGCTEQHQFCTWNASDCEPLTAADSLNEFPVTDLWSNANDQAMIQWAQKALILGLSAGVGDFFQALGASPLLARFSLVQGLQTGTLPRDQWQRELEHLFQGRLVSLQDAFVSAASGPLVPNLEALHIRPNSTSQTTMCKNQKIYSTLYYSFNVIGLCVILIVGTLFLVLDLSLQSIVSCIYKRRKHPRHTYSLLEWTATSTLQLQRLAHEELGFGTWDRYTKDIPTTHPGELLGVLDVSDEAHPRLMQVGQGDEKKEIGTTQDDRDKFAVVIHEGSDSDSRERTSGVVNEGVRSEQQERSSSESSTDPKAWKPKKDIS